MQTQVQTIKSDKSIVRLERIFQVQKNAFLNDPYPSADQRIERMKRIPKMLRKYLQQIHKALDEDFRGHSEHASDMLEILSMFDRVEFNAGNVKNWMKPIPKAGNLVTLGNAEIFLKSHPKGVVGNMVSWNFPFDIGLGPTIDALGAGNRVIIKPSELAPSCGLLLEEMIAETFEEDLVAVVNGDLELAKHFPSLKWDHLIYTGSGRVGKLVMKAASENLVPVTLELGGKSPIIVDENSVNPETIKSIAGIKAVKRGQMCVTGDYCFVPKAKLNEFASQIEEHYKNNFSTNNNGAAHACGIISDRHLNRLHALVDEAEKAGAKVINTGTDLKASGRHMPFHLVIDPPKEITLMQEEIFGPILPIIPYDDLTEVLDYINSNESPLGLYIYSKNNQFVDRICTSTKSGGVAVNVMALQAGIPSLPFGGVGASGMGVHHGVEGFREFSNQRGYFIKKQGGTYDSIMPPYTNKTDKLINDVAYAPLVKQAIFALKTLPKAMLQMIFRK